MRALCSHIVAGVLDRISMYLLVFDDSQLIRRMSKHLTMRTIFQTIDETFLCSFYLKMLNT